MSQTQPSKPAKVPPYTPLKAFDARLVYEVWLKLVAHEELYDAMLDGRHQTLAERYGLDKEQILIIDDFGGQPGTRWHMDNLRFRCTTMVSRVLKWHLPATVMMLTGGSDDWLRDLTYEYMSDHHWQDLGHHRRFAECARFATSVRAKLMKRRRPPEHLADVLHFELAIHELLQQAGKLAPGEWPATSAAPVESLRPRHARTAMTIELPVDIVAWLAKPEGPLAITKHEPTTAVAWVPSPADAHRVVGLDASAKALWDACRGDKTVRDLAAGSQPAEAMLKQWLTDGMIVT